MELDFTSADKLTEKQEKQIVKELNNQYNQALKEINKELAVMNAKAGSLSQTDLLKYNRLQKLEENINAHLTTLNRGKTQQVKGYLTDVYTTNYSGVTSKIAGVAGTTFAQIERQAVYNSILTPLAKIALEDNITSVKRNIRRALTQGIVQGQGIKDISKGIQSALETNANDATRIARTETTNVMSQSRMDAFKKSEEKGLRVVKIWEAHIDSRTRDSHASLNGEERPLDEPFSNGLMRPGDQSAGKPSETINCRCTMSTRVLEDDEKEESQEETFIPAQTQREAKTYINFSKGEEANKKLYTENHEKWEKSLTKDKKDAIKTYTDGASEKLNGYLRGNLKDLSDKELLEDMRKNLSSSLLEYDLEEPITTYRVLDKGFISSLDSNLEDLVGSVYNDKAFMSTSVSLDFLAYEQLFENEDIILKILIPKGKGVGAYINNLSEYKDAEFEFLIPENSSFNIIEKTMIGNRQTLVMEMIKK